jgi:general L-amino acid transport system permease protein
VEGRRRDVRAATALISTTRTSPPVPIGSGLSWSNPRTRTIVWQILVVAVVVAIAAAIAVHTAANLRARGIASGFDFLGRAAGFEISRGPIEFSSRDTYARALLVGLLNTLRVSLTGIVLATTLGVALGVARLSNVWIASTIARGYLEVIRNTPLLLQLLFWYSLTQGLPGPREALNPLPGVFLCFRGLFFPSLLWHSGYPWISAEWPVLVGFGFQGGASISPEFAALLVGLTTYTAAFIGEIVRGGVLAVDKGQREAAAALGLSRTRILRLVVLPQALRVIIPPTTSQFLNLVKNSSLAVAIGYPDLISITNTTLNQTGQAIEAIALAMTVYLGISVSLSLAMNAYNAAIVQRGGRSV